MFVRLNYNLYIYKASSGDEGMWFALANEKEPKYRAKVL